MAAQWEATGKTFVITGGASGLGAAYVEKFAKEGAKAVAILDVAEDVGKATANRVNQSYPGKVVFMKCDVSKEENITKAFDEVIAKFKQIDVIVNNAGIMVDAPNVWRTAADVNWQGLVSFTMKGINHMGKHKGGAGGTIINISSIAAISRHQFLPMYHGSKMAVLHFSQCISMAPFYENTGVRILTMCYGATDTPLLKGLEQRAYDPELGKIFVETVADIIDITQKVGSAVEAFYDMFQNGPPGSIWMSIHNKPAQNITADIDEAFLKWEKLTLP